MKCIGLPPVIPSLEERRNSPKVLVAVRLRPGVLLQLKGKLMAKKTPPPKKSSFWPVVIVVLLLLGFGGREAVKEEPACPPECKRIQPTEPDVDGTLPPGLDK